MTAGFLEEYASMRGGHSTALKGASRAQISSGQGVELGPEIGLGVSRV